MIQEKEQDHHLAKGNVQQREGRFICLQFGINMIVTDENVLNDDEQYKK